MKWQLGLTDEYNISRPSKTNFETRCKLLRRWRSNALRKKKITGMKLCSKLVSTIFIFPDDANRDGTRQDPTSHRLLKILGRLRLLSHWIVSRKGVLIAACLLLVAVIGYIDYITGYERPLLLFYLLPISLAVWFGNLLFGLSVAVIAIFAWMWSDLAAGIPALGFWNVGMAFASFAIFSGMLSKLRTLVRELDRRVLERTAALQREVAERQRLDREIAQVADRERHRLGQELHDSLGQHLTGTALA